MKKIIFASLFLLFLGINSQAQNNIIVQQSNSATTETTTDENAYYLNGISSKEDVGGVEYTFDYSGVSQKTYLKLTNYHNCTVTVLIDFLYGGWQKDKILNSGVKSYVLRANETKTISVSYGNSLGDNKIKGMIVRKLQ
ncbi:MAG: hypothetical protein IKJ52_09155 [Muribaculaceae bacterium]|nr:hypothetical protein [Muribaculaceae bacterium]